MMEVGAAAEEEAHDETIAQVRDTFRYYSVVAGAGQEAELKALTSSRIFSHYFPHQ